MIYRVTNPGRPIQPDISLPASKSISNRLLIIHSLAGGHGNLSSLSGSDDTLVLIDALESAGPVHDIGHAGTAMRFLTAYFSSKAGVVVLTGSKRMKERPIGPLVDALRSLGAEVKYLEKEGFPPLEITGKELEGGKLSIDGSISSQFISALLMVAPIMKNGLRLELTGDIVSYSYINMTLDLMKRNGAVCEWKDDLISVQGVGYRHIVTEVESDWSAASYWFSVSLLGKAIVQLTHLFSNSIQGDIALIEIFGSLGMKCGFKGDRLTIEPSAERIDQYLHYDFTNCPDITQTVAVSLCLEEIPFRLTGTKTLRIKETDRILALQKELAKFGFVIQSDKAGSYIEWNGERCNPHKDPIIETYHDHRMAMAFAPAALTLGKIDITDPLVVTKSYPNFWEDLSNAGFLVERVG